MFTKRGAYERLNEGHKGDQLANKQKNRFGIMWGKAEDDPSRRQHSPVEIEHLT